MGAREVICEALSILQANGSHEVWPVIEQAAACSRDNMALDLMVSPHKMQLADDDTMESVEPLRCSLGALGEVLGASLGSFWVLLRVLGRLRVLWCSPGGLLGNLLGGLGASWGSVGASWGVFGTSLDSFWVLVGVSWSLFGRSWGILEALWELWGASWEPKRFQSHDHT